MNNAASTCIKAEGVLKIKELCERDDTTLEIVDFAAMATAAPTAEPAKDNKKKGGKGNKQEKDKPEQGAKLSKDAKKKLKD